MASDDIVEPFHDHAKSILLGAVNRTRGYGSDKSTRDNSTNGGTHV